MGRGSGSQTRSKAWIGYGAMLALGVGAGWLAARQWPARAAPPPPQSQDWVARIGATYIDVADVTAEMRRRGGERPGLFQDAAAKRALLDDMLVQQALVQAARDAGLDQESETRRAIEQLLVSRHLERSLRQTQQALRVDSNEVVAYYERHTADYAVPARRRVAMLRIEVAPDSPGPVWEAAEQRAREALGKVRALQPAVPDFGAVAIEYSADQASRYRGGSLGWLTDARRDSYSLDPALRDAAFALATPGDFSEVVRGADGVYVARLIELQAPQARPLEELRGGIAQMLLQQRYAATETKFRDDALAAADIDVREDRLAAIQPPGPPAPTEPTPPPAVPGVQEAAP